MEPVTASITIGRPPAEVYDYLVDVANHPEFSDHYLVDFRLTREASRGRGAGARFRLKTRRTRFGWADVVVVEADPPRLIAMHGRGGKFNRTRFVATFALSPGPSSSTRLSLTTETDPGAPGDRFVEALGLRPWMRRQTARAVRRIRSILEEGADRGARATIAGG